MDVEIDDRDAGEPVHLARPQRADRDVVEQAEPHRPAGLGMMAGRADGAERVVGLAADNRIDRGDDRAGGAQRRSSRSRRQDRVGIDPDMAGFGHRRRACARRGRAGEPAARSSSAASGASRRSSRANSGRVERRQHRAQPRRRFRMMSGRDRARDRPGGCRAVSSSALLTVCECRTTCLVRANRRARDAAVFSAGARRGVAKRRPAEQQRDAAERRHPAEPARPGRRPARTG